MRKISMIALMAMAGLLVASSAMALDATEVVIPQPADGLDSIGVDATAAGSWIAYDGANVLYNSDSAIAGTIADWDDMGALAGPDSGDAGFVVAAGSPLIGFTQEAALIGVGGTGALHWAKVTRSLLPWGTPTYAVTDLNEAVPGAVFGEALNASKYILSVDGADGSELGIVDNSVKAEGNTSYVAVVTGLPDNAGGLVVYNGKLYAGTSTDDATGEIRVFKVSQLLLNYSAQIAGAKAAPLTWEDGGTIVDFAAYTGFGPTDATNLGTLMVCDTATDGSPRVAFIDTSAGSITDIITLTGDECNIVSYNPKTGQALAVVESADGLTGLLSEVFERGSIFNRIGGIISTIFILSLLSYLVAWLFF